jgi:hypothetical protein
LKPAIRSSLILEALEGIVLAAQEFKNQRLDQIFISSDMVNKWDDIVDFENSQKSKSSITI